ncbi:MAG TPA: hypothetical protein VIU62_02005 [Chloroflexota bacterium]|jgi:hypothetical protein
MDRSSRRVVDDDRLNGLWLQHASSEYVFYAPVRFPDDTFGLAQVELRTVANHARRTIHWWLFDRTGLRDSGELDLPAVAFWQALAHVERLLRDRGIQLQGSDHAKE